MNIMTGFALNYLDSFIFSSISMALGRKRARHAHTSSTPQKHMAQAGARLACHGSQRTAGIAYAYCSLKSYKLLGRWCPCTRCDRFRFEYVAHRCKIERVSFSNFLVASMFGKKSSRFFNGVRESPRLLAHTSSASDHHEQKVTRVSHLKQRRAAK